MFDLQHRPPTGADMTVGDDDRLLNTLNIRLTAQGDSPEYGLYTLMDEKQVATLRDYLTSWLEEQETLRSIPKDRVLYRVDGFTGRKWEPVDANVDSLAEARVIAGEQESYGRPHRIIKITTSYTREE